MSEKMEAVVKVEGKEGGTEIKEVPVPEVGVNDVKIEVDMASICGTDVHIYMATSSAVMLWKWAPMSIMSRKENTFRANVTSLVATASTAALV